MKQVQTIVNTVLACTLTFILFSAGLPSFAARAAAPTPTPEVAGETESTCDPTRTINVSGTAVVNVAPDRALVQLGVQSNGRSPKEVQARNAAAISQVIKAVKAQGVEAKDITTDWYVIEPLYEDYDSLYIKGYRIYNVVAITMREVGKTSDVIAAAFQAGANQVVNVEFYTSELRKYRDQARQMAMQAASEKAGALAETAGSETGCVLSINENTWSYFNGWGWGWWWRGSNNQNLWTQNAVQNAAPSGGEMPSGEGDPVSTGQISIRAEVNATFSLK
jgi:uncharacterized protein YggE